MEGLTIIQNWWRGVASENEAEQVVHTLSWLFLVVALICASAVIFVFQGGWLSAILFLAAVLSFTLALFFSSELCAVGICMFPVFYVILIAVVGAGPKNFSLPLLSPTLKKLFLFIAIITVLCWESDPKFSLPLRKRK